MGLIKAAMGAVTGALADQWLETFQPDEMSDRTVFAKGVPVRKDKRSSNTKGTQDIISNGSIVQVYDNQCMLLVEGGKIVDFTAEPGYFKVENSSSLPFLQVIFQILRQLYLKTHLNALNSAAHRQVHRKFSM